MKKFTQFRLGFISTGASIIIAAAIIAIAIIIALKPAGKTTVVTTDNSANTANQGPAINLRPITAADHILGNPNAPIRIVEFSDPSCPYCKIFTPNIEKVMDTYGASGTVAWVYRSFPLDKPDGS